MTRTFFYKVEGKLKKIEAPAETIDGCVKCATEILAGWETKDYTYLGFCEKQAIAKVESLAAKYGFATQENACGGNIPDIARDQEAYVNIAIRTSCKYSTDFDLETKTSKNHVTANANICKMNPNSDADELLAAADEIKNAALFVKEFNSLELYYIEEHE